MPALVEIYNAALSAATGRALLSLPNENTREAAVCNLWYPFVRDQAFRAAPWNCLKANTYLGVITERDFAATWTQGMPKDPWRYAYGLPSDCVRPRFITTYVPFELGLYTPAAATPAEGSYQAIFTNQPQAILEYTAKVENTEMWDADLTMSIVYALAAHITNPLHGKRAIQENNINLANNIIMTARMNDANTQERQMETVPDWISARGYYEAAPKTRFHYQYGPMFSLSTQVLAGNV